MILTEININKGNFDIKLNKKGEPPIIFIPANLSQLAQIPLRLTSLSEKVSYLVR